MNDSANIYKLEKQIQEVKNRSNFGEPIVNDGTCYNNCWVLLDSQIFQLGEIFDSGFWKKTKTRFVWGTPEELKRCILVERP